MELLEVTEELVGTGGMGGSGGSVSGKGGMGAGSYRNILPLSHW